jgi:hypothetical protein
MSTIHSSFLSALITPDLSTMSVVFHGFFTWIAVDDVDLHFSFMLMRKANIGQEETK